MTESTHYRNPRPGRLPGCVSMAMVYSCLRALPPPRQGGPADFGRQHIQDALGMIDALSPRDVLEAMLVV